MIPFFTAVVPANSTQKVSGHAHLQTPRSVNPKIRAQQYRRIALIAPPSSLQQALQCLRAGPSNLTLLLRFSAVHPMTDLTRQIGSASCRERGAGPQKTD